MIPGLTFHGSRAYEQSASSTAQVQATEAASVEPTRTPPVQPTDAGGETRHTRRDLDREADGDAKRARAQDARAVAIRSEGQANTTEARESTRPVAMRSEGHADTTAARESTRPVAGNPVATMRKMQTALNEALAPPVSPEDAEAAARASRHLMEAQAEVRRVAAAKLYADVEPGTPSPSLERGDEVDTKA